MAELTPAEALAYLQNYAISKTTGDETPRMRQAFFSLSKSVADTRRLDWLQETGAMVAGMMNGGFACRGAECDTVRAAIDAARTPAPGERS
jgi:hypothetical protein